jgi:tetratricopeptide (TPR) repeat protein
VPPAIRALALMSATGQALLEGNLARAQQHCHASLAIFETLDDSDDEARTLFLAGMLSAIKGEFEPARTLFQDSLTLSQRLGARRIEGWALGFLGQVDTFTGDYEQASALLEASRMILREVGDVFGLATSLLRAGDVACSQGNLPEARAHYEESLAQFHSAGLLGRPTVLHNLACVLREQGEPARATAVFQDGLSLYHGRGDEAGVARCLLGLSDLALDASEPRLAARLLGAADRLPRGTPHGLLGGWVWTAERRSYEQQVAAARDALGEADFAAAFGEGQALTLEQAVAEAHRDRDRRPDQDVTLLGAPPAASGRPAGTVLDLQTRLARRSSEQPPAQGASQA